jgi:predicted Zn-dependent protease
MTSGPEAQDETGSGAGAAGEPGAAGSPAAAGTAPTRGFGYSNRRIGVEVVLLVGGALLLVFGALWGARALAGSLARSAPPELDSTLGAQSWEGLAPESRRCKDPGPKAYVEELAAPLVKATTTPFEFQFTVVDDPAINAFALPGGFVTVNFGLLEKAKTGEEVAGVLAHELSHVTERHGTQRVLRQLGGFAAMSVLFGGTDIEVPTQVLSGLVHTAYDRAQETEADTVGIAVLKKAGVDPGGMADFFHRLREESPVNPPELLSTHPDPGNRAEKVREAATGFRPTLSLPKPANLRCNP